MLKALSCLILLFFVSFALLSQTNVSSKDADVAILFDNDVHCSVDGYAVMADYKDSLLRAGKEVVVVSCGDFVSGSSLGSYSRGEYPVRLLNAVGYDYVALGNHEFDYGMERLCQIDSMINSKVLCCNFRHIAGNKPVFAPWAMHCFSSSDAKVAFVGVATPSTMASSSPSYFKQTVDGDFIYTFGKDSLFVWVQQSVDSARANGANYVVVLSHLGDVDDYPTSIDLVSHLHDVDVVLDGHSHSVIHGKKFADIYGDSVLLCSTGSKFQHIGLLSLSSSSHAATSKLLSSDRKIQSGVARVVGDTIETIRQSIYAFMQRYIGYSKTTLRCDNDEGHRLVRMYEMPLGDMCADAFRQVLKADIGWVNGGGIRSSLKTGELTYGDIYSVFPFNNNAALVEITGQNLIDALEMAYRLAPYPFGAFPQVSGLRIVVDTSVVSSVEVSDEGISSLPDSIRQRRVCKVEVWDTIENEYRLIDPYATYRLASTTYTLCNSGDGIVIPYSRLILTTASSDAQILEEYISQYLQGVISSSYAQSQNRIIYK